jgi:hypothetical protein
MNLSILCVTRFERHALPFIADMASLAKDLDAEFVLAADGARPYQSLNALGYQPWRVASTGYVESVLDDALALCQGDYVLRLDDDERCSAGMRRWLVNGGYLSARHWRFARAHLWRDTRHVLVTPHLWPDVQTRLSLRNMAGGRSAIHSGSPHGGGTDAPCSIEHHKFLVKSLEERREIIARYDSIQPGAGSQFRAFSCPEDFYTAQDIADATCWWDGESPERVAA